MRIQKLRVFCSLLLLSACAQPAPNAFKPLAASQPYVIGLSPEPYQALERMEGIEIRFARPIDPASLSPEAVYVARGEIPKEEISEDSLSKVAAELEASEDLQTLTWRPQEELQTGDYTLVISPELQGGDHQPFNQHPGEDPEPFLAVFYLGSAQHLADPSTASSSGPSGPSENLHPPAFLTLHEVLYDASGSDTDGNEFIELYGTPGADLDHYQILFINGSDGEILDTINIKSHSKIRDDGLFLIADARTNASTASNITGADLLDNFDPQNGPDAIQLLDPQGRLVDALCYGNGSLPLARNGLETCEGAAAPDVAGGHSLSRLQGGDTNDNAADFFDLSQPTPGEI